MSFNYVVDLNEAKLFQLQSLIKTGKHKARTITRANILLMASEGYSDSAIASTLRINVSTPERTREKFVVGGLVVDNLNIHNPAALYEVFEPPEARSRIVQKLEFHYTPKHARSVKSGGNRIICFIPSVLRATNSRSTNIEISSFSLGRNSDRQERASVNWRFKTKDARNKLERLYPSV